MTPDTERERIALRIADELDRAYAKHGRAPWSRHEFYAILLEEVDELWDAIKSDESQDRVDSEAVQVAAMCFRYFETRIRAESRAGSIGGNEAASDKAPASDVSRDDRDAGADLLDTRAPGSSAPDCTQVANPSLPAAPAQAGDGDRERALRLKVLTEVHEYWEFDAFDEDQFDTWLHEEIKKCRAAIRAESGGPTP